MLTQTPLAGGGASTSVLMTLGSDPPTPLVKWIQEEEGLVKLVQSVIMGCSMLLLINPRRTCAQDYSTCLCVFHSVPCFFVFLQSIDTCTHTPPHLLGHACLVLLVFCECLRRSHHSWTAPLLRNSKESELRLLQEPACPHWSTNVHMQMQNSYITSPAQN